MGNLSRTTKVSSDYIDQGRTISYTGVFMGFVKDNKDIQKMGRLRVWIPEFNSQPADENGWITVSYASPFAGVTNTANLGNNITKSKDAQTSYGWWTIPPDLENLVVVTFINGDPTRGIWFGCLYQQNMNNMVPGVPAGQNYQNTGQDVPLMEYNRRTKEKPKDDMIRPELPGAKIGIAAQGLIKDNVRGTTTTSARRESPSQVYGFLTPGPVDPDSTTTDSQNGQGGKRLGGSSFYLDDGTEHEHVRIRTRSGAQLLIDETNGIVYAINKAGTGWIQMDAEGNVDIFGAKSVSVRAQEDINLRADRDINIEAGGALNINSGATKIQTAALDVTSAAMKVQADSLDVTSDGVLVLDAAGKMSLKGSQIHGRATADVSFDGAIVNIQKGSAQPASAAAATPPGTASKTNVLAGFESDGFTRQTASIDTIVSRLPTYEPCPEHNNKGTS